MTGRTRRMALLVGRICIAAAFVTMASSLHLGNAYLRSREFDSVRVARAESAWEIAARYTADTEERRALAEAIIEVNGLSADGRLRAGQSLRVPVLKRTEDARRVAER